MFYCLTRMGLIYWYTGWAQLAAAWWGVLLARGCRFTGQPRFNRHPGSRINIGSQCKFNSSPTSNLIGINRPCIITTLKEGAELIISEGCGFSGTVITCAHRILLGSNVRCGANTLISDTDWHTDDPRAGLDAPITIGNDVWLGVNVMVLKGVTIGEGTLVGAGSLVTKSLPAHVVAAGVPAKIIKQLK